MLNGTTQDAHEFFMFLTEELESQKHTFRWFESNFVSNVRRVVECQNCKTAYESFERCQGFVLNIENQESVKSAMDLYFDWEWVCGYYCNCCKKKVAARKRLSLVSTSPCICIALKRFSGTRKICRKIEITEEFTASKYFDKTSEESKSKYKLASTVNHIGPSRGSGYYTATSRIQYNEFYEFDDTNVIKLGQNAIRGNEAYILFNEYIEVIPS